VRVHARWALIAILLVIAGCAANQPIEPVHSSPNAGQATSTGASGSVTRTPPPPPLEAAWLAAQAITCGDNLFFSPAVLAQLAHDEEGPDPVSVALREHLAGGAQLEEPATRPTTGWHRVVQTAVQVQFVAISTDRKGLWVAGFQARDGLWELVLDGACQGQVKRPAGLGPADWWLDESFARPQGDDRVIHGRLVEGSCASGRSPEGRVGQPVIAYFQDAIVVTMSVRPRPGGQDCPSNPDFAFTIPLAEPLGTRRLFDGGRFPPRDASVRPG
jgi:hypothetical protein